ncbi:hypothetical protein [Helicovermis profundi]|uniref:Type II secretion system protein GspF domain-containing protein n=1 Tax=Helicovermis profundi TaxID=3065157 RepID=A0AAU9E6S7_9FIRM|nr:hypothetical protein HLPR_27600 [Clostridia bacterium S502]
MKISIIAFTTVIIYAAVVYLVLILRNNLIINKYFTRNSKMYSDEKMLRNSFRIKKSFLDDINRKYLIKSGITLLFPSLSIYSFIGIIVIIFFITLFFSSITMSISIPSISMSLIISLFPIIGLDMFRKYNSTKSRKLLVNFIGTMNRWCQVKEDVFFCFEKTLHTGIGNPIDRYISDFLVQVNTGVDAVEALEIFQSKIDNEIFRVFIINIKEAVKSRGNLLKLFSGLEEEAYKLEEEFNRRKISLFKDKLLIYVIMVSVIAIYYYLINNNISVRNFYLNTNTGRILLAVYSIIFFLGFLLSLELNKYNY